MSSPTRDRQLPRSLWALLFLFASVIWSVHITRPVDLPSWHEFDYSSIARNFLREGNNILYPRIDWRRNGPGFTEMEFPIIPWIMAQFYRVFGIHEFIGRIFSLVSTLLALTVFSRLARKLLPDRAAFIAALFFVVAHLVTQVATALQPEALMLLFYLLAVYYFLDWYETSSWLAYSFAAAAFASAILIKSPAAHLAIFFLLWALYKDGYTAFCRPSLYLFAVLAFLPPALWYLHAATFWRDFHNSMGVSNEDHWMGLDLLKRPKVIAGLLAIDGLLVSAVGAAAVSAIALFKDKLRTTVNRVALYWIVAIAIYLLVILRTAGAYWASYYHVILVPPIALLLGAGMDKVLIREPRQWRSVLLRCGLAAIAFDTLLVLASNHHSTSWAGVLQDFLGMYTSPAVLVVLPVLSFGVVVLCLFTREVDDRYLMDAGTGTTLNLFLILSCFTALFWSGQMLWNTWQTFNHPSSEYLSAQYLKNKIPSGALIVVSGGPCSDATGHRLAADAPNMFYWLDRKGFASCEETTSVPQLRLMAGQGARYFIADRKSLNRQPGLENQLRNSFIFMAECEPSLLFSLQPRNTVKP